MASDELEKKIDNKLSKLNLPPFSDLEPKIQRYIKNTEQIFIEIMNKREEAIKTYKGNKISVKFVADKIGVERQTIHNHPHLYNYVKHLQYEQQQSDVLNKITDLQSKLKEKENDFLLLFERDVTIEQLKYQIKELNAQALVMEMQIEQYEIEKNNSVNGDNKKDNVVRFHRKRENK